MESETETETETQTESHAGAWAEQERETETEKLAGPDWETNLAEREVGYLAGQSPASSYGIGGEWGWLRRWRGTGNRAGFVVTSRSRKEGQGRPPVEENGLLRGKEGKEKKFVNWRATRETGGRQVDGENLDEPSPRIKEGWRPKRDNPWDTQDRKGIRAQLNAPRKEQIAWGCVQEQHRKVLGRKRAGNRRLW
jgi:hypothetical protein